MNNHIIYHQIINFIIYNALQLLCIYANIPYCYIYISFLMMLPIQQQHTITCLWISFFTGLFIDSMYDSWGLHAFIAVLITYSRSLFLPYIIPIYKYKKITILNIKKIGFKKFSIIIFFLIVLYYILIFIINIGITYTLLINNISITYIIALAAQYIFHHRNQANYS